MYKKDDIDKIKSNCRQSQIISLAAIAISESDKRARKEARAKHV